MAHRLVDLRIPTTPRGSITRSRWRTLRPVRRRNGAEPRKARRRLLKFGAVEQAKRWCLRVGWFECWECCDDQWNDFAVLAGHSGGEHLLGFGANRAARSG